MLEEKEVLSLLLGIVSENYTKILLVNISDYTYTSVKIPEDELPFITDNKIVNYWNWFCNCDLLNSEDRSKCIKYGTDFKYGTHLIYRRKQPNGAWHWMLMELTKPKKYKGNEYCACLVRDIDNIYGPAYEEAVEEIGTKDEKTGLRNELGFHHDCAKITNEIVAILYADVNGLKYVNDNDGHEAGDKLIVSFATLLRINFPNSAIYRLHGDEFAVMESNEARSFVKCATKFHKSMWFGSDVPIASMGVSVGSAKEIAQIISDAEECMRDDKSMFYQQFPKYRRL